MNSGDKGFVHLQTTFLNESLRFRWILNYWLSFRGVREFCQIDFLCHNETVVFNALGSFFCCILDLDSVFRGVLLSIPTLEARVFGCQFNHYLPFDTSQFLIFFCISNGASLVTPISSLGLHTCLNSFLSLFFVQEEPQIEEMLLC